jgi:cobalt-zinc-cadmium efflux system outer membrane protein
MHVMPALAGALFFAAGCATPRYDLESVKDHGATTLSAPLPSGIVRQAGFEEEAPSPDGRPDKRADESVPRKLEKRLEIPKELPGADVQVLRLPKKTPGDEESYNAAIKKLFPSLIDPPPLDTGAEGLRPKLTLAELEQMGLASSPVIAQFQADIATQLGQAIQAGTHPNPTVGYESDTVGSSFTRDYQGVYASQFIKTAGKLELAQAIQNVDVMNAQLALRQARNDLLSQIRREYFALLIARESLKINEAIVRFTHEVYRIQVDQVTEGQAAVYEPMQLRTLAVQARGALLAARQSYIATWKQLAATLNVPALPLADLADHPDIPVPDIDYDAAVSHVLSMNTEVKTARNAPIQAQLALRLAEVTPFPDVFVYATFQRDFTTPGQGRTSYNSQVGIPLPIFDRNKGNILAARGALLRAANELPRVENDLRSRLADAFARFETNRVLVQYQRDRILPDSVRTYRGTYERHVQAPEEVGFADVVVAQQNLLASVGAYISALYAQWAAFVDLAALLQVERLEELRLRLNDTGDASKPRDGTDRGGDVDKAIAELLSGENAAAK